jgi:hypothetical protein
MNELQTRITVGAYDLHEIAPHDLSTLADAVSHVNSALWAAYPPFVLAYGQSSARKVMLTELDDGLAILVQRKIRRTLHLDYLIPPLVVGCTSDLTREIAAFNGELETRMLWADLPTVAVWKSDGWEFSDNEREYVYRREQVLSMSGGRFAMLRKRTHRCEREIQPEIRDFTPGDIVKCVDLLNRWQDLREADCAPVFDYRYTRSALEMATDIPGMVGIVAVVDGVIRAFAFGGTTAGRTGCFFLLKSDPTVRGLSEYVRVQLMQRLDDCDLINDAGDLDRKGLARHKNLFRPVAFVPTWKGRFRG